jgi:hypothetical protein
MGFSSFHRLRSARPAFSLITRLTATATVAYLLALLIPVGTSRPVLAPLTALLVLQASLYQTIRSGIRKVASVTAGVLIAVGVAEFVGFSWWQLALVIAGSLLAGRALRLGDDLLEVPISAMLIFASAGSHSAAAGRVVDTLIGTAAGLAGGLIFGAPRVRPATEAVGTLAGRLADLLSRMAGDLSAPGGCAGAADGPGLPEAAADGPGTECVEGWLHEARALRDEIERVDDTLRQAAESVRLNPRGRLTGRPPRPGQQAPADPLATQVALRDGLETLEHSTVTVRGLARSILDSAGIDSDRSPARDPRTRARLAGVLGNLAAAIRTYRRLVQALPADSEQLREQLAGQLAAAHREQDELAALLEPRAAADGGSSEWPLRGAILTHVDRLRTGLRPDAALRPAPSRPAGLTRGRPRRRSSPRPGRSPARRERTADRRDRSARRRDRIAARGGRLRDRGDGARVARVRRGLNRARPAAVRYPWRSHSSAHRAR